MVCFPRLRTRPHLQAQDSLKFRLNIFLEIFSRVEGGSLCVVPLPRSTNVIWEFVGNENSLARTQTLLN